jgi:hypothetical protein
MSKGSVRSLSVVEGLRTNGRDVDLSPRVIEDLQALSSDATARILKKLRQLEDSLFPRGDTVKQLQGFDPDLPPQDRRLPGRLPDLRDRGRHPPDHPPKRTGTRPARSGVAAENVEHLAPAQFDVTVRLAGFPVKAVDAEDAILDPGDVEIPGGDVVGVY